MKNNKNVWIVIAVIALLVLYQGGQSGWLKSVTNNFGGTTYNPSSSNPAVITPTILPPVAEADKALTCSQKAAKANADAYYTEQFNTAKQCLDYSILDCKDKGKTLEGYGIDGTCCYYVCVAVAQQPAATCSETDGGSEIFLAGTTTLGSSSNQDVCTNAVSLLEYYCSNGAKKVSQVDCEHGCTMGLDGGYCEQFAAPFCTDSDAPAPFTGPGGDNPWTKGTCTDNSGAHTDSCYDIERLTEWTCQNKACIRTTAPIQQNCAGEPGYICLNGACVEGGVI